MSLLQTENAIYHHPLDAVTGETVIGTPWTQSEGRFDTGKVGQGMEGTPTGSLVFTTPVAYSNTDSNQGAGTFAATKVDETRIAIAFSDSRGNTGTNNQFGSGIVATIGSGPSLSFGSKNSFLLHSTISDFIANNINLHRIDTNKLIVSYRQNDTIPNTTRVAVVTVGESLSDAPSVNISVDPSTEGTSDTLDSTHFIALYRPANDGFDRAVVGTVSGTSIVLGTPVIFQGAATSLVVVGLSSTKALAVYKHENVGKARVFERTGSSLSFGPLVTFTGAVFDNSSTRTHSARWAVALSSTKAVVMTGPSGEAAHIATINGLDVTFGPVSPAFGTTGLVSFDKVDSNTFVWASSAGAITAGKARVGFVNGTNISLGPALTFTDGLGSAVTAAVVAVGPTDDITTHIFVTSGDSETPAETPHPADATVTCLLAAADLTATSGAYTTTVGSSKLAYSAWLKDPSTQCS